MKTQAVAYIRVSSGIQVDEGSSLQAQEGIIRKYAELNNLEITEIICDKGLSGRRGKRPGFERLMRAVNEKKTQAVVVYAMARFIRNTKELLSCVEQMVANEVQFHSYKEKIDTSSALGTFFLTLTAALNQLESDQLGERISDVKAFNKANGRTYSAPIYGFDNDKINHTLVPNEEMATVKRIIESSKDGQSFGGICSFLNETKVPTKNGGLWHRSTIRNIVNNDVYKNI